MASEDTASTPSMSQREIELLNHLARASLTAREYAEANAKSGDTQREQLWLEATKKFAFPEQWMWKFCEFKIFKTGDGESSSQGLTNSQSSEMFKAFGIIFGFKEIPKDIDLDYLVNMCVRLAINITPTEEELLSEVQNEGAHRDTNDVEMSEADETISRETFKEWMESLDRDEMEWAQGLQMAILIVGGYEGLRFQSIKGEQFSPKYILKASGHIMDAHKAWFKIYRGRQLGDTEMQLAYESALASINSLVNSAVEPSISMQDLFLISNKEAEKAKAIDQITEANKQDWTETVAWKIWSELILLKAVFAPGFNFLLEQYPKFFTTSFENYRPQEDINFEARSIDNLSSSSTIVKDSETHKIRDVEMVPAPKVAIPVERIFEIIRTSLIEPLITKSSSNSKELDISNSTKDDIEFDDILKAMKKSFSVCLHPESCKNGRIIKAHSISKKKFLKLLEEKNEVIARKQNPGYFIDKRKGGIYSLFDTRGWKNQATIFKGLCSSHDKELFYMIDNLPPDWKNSEYLFRHAYRAVLFELYHRILALRILSDDAIKGFTIVEDIMIPSLLYTTKCIEFKRAMDYALLQEDWDSIVHIVYNIPHRGTPPSVAVSSCVPLHDIDDLYPPIFALSLMPDADQSVVIFSTIKKEEHHMEAYIGKHIPASSDTAEFKQQLSKFVIQHCNNFVLSPKFWNSLSKETRQKIENFYIHTEFANDHSFEDPDLNLFYTENSASHPETGKRVNTA